MSDGGELTAWAVQKSVFKVDGRSRWGVRARQYRSVGGRWKIQASGDWFPDYSDAKQDGLARWGHEGFRMSGITNGAPALTGVDSLVEDAALAAELKLSLSPKAVFALAYTPADEKRRWHFALVRRFHEMPDLQDVGGRLSQRKEKGTFWIIEKKFGALSNTQQQAYAAALGLAIMQVKGMWAVLEPEKPLDKQRCVPLNQAIKITREEELGIE